jgi:SAM-dependent methyltransferase
VLTPPPETFAGKAVRGIHQRVRARLLDRPLRTAIGPCTGASALEPGGPSRLFSLYGAVQVYPRLASLDLVDFAESTLWSGAADDTGAPIRQRLIGEAGALPALASDSYDVVLASHVLEHLANPLGALAEWSRIVRPGGRLLLIVPHRDGTFDHRRPVTSIEHLIDDAERGTTEDDLTHLPEVLELHDLTRDQGSPSRELFEQRARENLLTRGMHHHVFVSQTVVQACEAAGLKVLLLRPQLPFDIVCVCAVDAQSESISQAELASVLSRSPFPSDRTGST